MPILSDICNQHREIPLSKFVFTNQQTHTHEFLSTNLFALVEKKHTLS